MPRDYAIVRMRRDTHAKIKAQAAHAGVTLLDWLDFAVDKASRAIEDAPDTRFEPCDLCKRHTPRPAAKHSGHDRRCPLFREAIQP